MLTTILLIRIYAYDKQSQAFSLTFHFTFRYKGSHFKRGVHVLDCYPEWPARLVYIRAVLYHRKRRSKGCQEEIQAHGT